jgi:hypothetical protein
MAEEQHMWERSLITVLELMSDSAAEWMVVGSAATALQGVSIDPGDIDILARHPRDVNTIAALLGTYVAETSPSTDHEDFLSTSASPTTTSGDGVWTFGRWWVSGTKVEVAHIADDPGSGAVIETAGHEVWRHRRNIHWRGFDVSVVPLEIQLATSRSRALTYRPDAIAQFLAVHGEDSELLAWAMRSRGLQ